MLASGQVGDTDGYTTLDEIRKIDFTDEKAVNGEIEAFCQEFATADVEHGLVISPNGKVYKLTGLTAAVNTGLVGEEALRGSIGIHNHPIKTG